MNTINFIDYVISMDKSEVSRCILCMYDGYGHAAYDMAPDYKERILEFLK